MSQPCHLLAFTHESQRLVVRHVPWPVRQDASCVLGIGQPDRSCPLGLLSLEYQERALSELAGQGANSHGKAFAPEGLGVGLADVLGLPGETAPMADDDVGWFDIPARRSGMLRELPTSATRRKARACGPSTWLLAWMLGTLPA